MREIFKTKLEILNKDQLTLDALRTVLEARIEAEKPVIGDSNDDTLLGQKYRAYEKAKDILTGFFLDIDSYKENLKSNECFNKER